MGDEGLARQTRADSLTELAEATDRLVATVRRLDDSALAAPSGLPGWTRGHVVAHLARNADGLGNLAPWAETGIETPMYASRDARAAAIEADAYRTAAVQLADLVGSAEALADRLAAMGPHADDAHLCLVSGAEVEGWELAAPAAPGGRDPPRRPRGRIRRGGLARRPSRPGTLDQVAPGFAGREGMPFGRIVDDTGRSWTVGDSPCDGHRVGRGPSSAGWSAARTAPT